MVSFLDKGRMMQESLRKPRVFLSHSKKDIEFIRRLDADLRACQCETWIDEIEIRHGKPWLDEIFSAGIPSCEIVLCYITSNSVQSVMVRQEIDARLIERMQNEHVAILPYVSSEDIRIQLRSDLQSFQIPVLNDATYAQMFPRIVAQVWRSHLDWAVSQAIQSEKIRRLELELKVRELQDQSTGTIFSTTETADFSTIWSWINREFQTDIQLQKKNSKESPQVISCTLNFGNLYRRAIAPQQFTISLYSISDALKNDAVAICQVDPDDVEIGYDLPLNLEAEFLKFGFLTRMPRQINGDSHNPFARFIERRYDLVLTAKFDRFNYWIAHTHGEVSLASAILTHTEK